MGQNGRHWRGTLCQVRFLAYSRQYDRLRVVVAWCPSLLGETTEVPALMKSKFLPDPQPMPATRGQDDFQRVPRR